MRHYKKTLKKKKIQAPKRHPGANYLKTTRKPTSMPMLLLKTIPLIIKTRVTSMTKNPLLLILAHLIKAPKINYRNKKAIKREIQTTKVQIRKAQTSKGKRSKPLRRPAKVAKSRRKILIRQSIRRQKKRPNQVQRR